MPSELYHTNLSSDEAGQPRPAKRKRSCRDPKPRRSKRGLTSMAQGEERVEGRDENVLPDVETFSLDVNGTTSSATAYGPEVLVSSPSLAKILHPRHSDPFVPTRNPTSSVSASSTATVGGANSTASSSTIAPSLPEPEPLSEYTCPICFFPPSNATLTPCGHICCGSCLFTAVKSTMQRAAAMARVEADIPRCPVCRADIPGWDGKGGGVIGLRPRAVIAL